MRTWQIWKGDVLVCDGLSKRFADIKLANELQRNPKAWGWHIRPQAPTPPRPRTRQKVLNELPPLQ